ncbi:MAG: hypothetical protein CHACPFDD_02849 [Phycisphaerae bacterium]|nr:hypothetical protein [Phycisphaerae bacterium]
MILPLSYNWRNLFVRKLSTGLTFIVVAVIVLVLAVLLSFAAGIRASLVATGSPLNLIVLKPGATAESTSILQPEEIARVVQTPGVARQADGALMISSEVAVQSAIPRLGQRDRPANVAIRGVDVLAYAVHDNVRLVEGRWPDAGKMEVAVGRAAQKRFAGLRLNESIALGRLGNRDYTVVGVFEADGGALESEVWGPRPQIQDSFERDVVSSVVVRLGGPADVEPAVAYIRSAAVQLDAKPETEYYRELTAKTTEIVMLTSVLIGIMAVGAAFAVANTMYAAVDGRRREIAMLRTIGFSRGAVVLSFVIESVLICTLACVFGLTASVGFNGMRQDFLSDTTWTVLAYELRLTPGIVAWAFALSVVVGVAGAAAPALRAARLRVIDALRKA